MKRVRDMIITHSQEYYTCSTEQIVLKARGKYLKMGLRHWHTNVKFVAYLSKLFVPCFLVYLRTAGFKKCFSGINGLLRMSTPKLSALSRIWVSYPVGVNPHSFRMVSQYLARKLFKDIVNEKKMQEILFRES